MYKEKKWRVDVGDDYYFVIAESFFVDNQHEGAHLYFYNKNETVAIFKQWDNMLDAEHAGLEE